MVTYQRRMARHPDPCTLLKLPCYAPAPADELRSCRDAREGPSWSKQGLHGINERVQSWSGVPLPVLTSSSANRRLAVVVSQAPLSTDRNRPQDGAASESYLLP